MCSTLDVTDKLRALRGNISIDYEWRQEEAQELLAQAEREKFLESCCSSKQAIKP